MNHRQDNFNLLMNHVSQISDPPNSHFDDLIAKFSEESAKTKKKDTRKRVLIVGGGSCFYEIKLLKATMWTDYEVFLVDKAVPTYLANTQLTWIDEFMPNALDKIEKENFDLFICLANSYYWPDSVKIYEKCFTLLNPGAMIVTDFLLTPPIRKAVNQILRDWLLDSTTSENLFVRVNSLTELSFQLNRSLHESSYVPDICVEELGMDNSHINTQQLAYESLWPLWFKIGASRQEIERYTLWQVLSHGELSMSFDINSFAKQNKLSVNRIVRIAKNRTGLIATKT